MQNLYIQSFQNFIMTITKVSKHFRLFNSQIVSVIILLMFQCTLINQVSCVKGMIGKGTVQSNNDEKNADVEDQEKIYESNSKGIFNNQFPWWATILIIAPSGILIALFIGISILTCCYKLTLKKAFIVLVCCDWRLFPNKRFGKNRQRRTVAIKPNQQKHHDQENEEAIITENRQSGGSNEENENLKMEPKGECFDQEFGNQRPFDQNLQIHTNNQVHQKLEINQNVLNQSLRKGLTQICGYKIKIKEPGQNHVNNNHDIKIGNQLQDCFTLSSANEYNSKRSNHVRIAPFQQQIKHSQTTQKIMNKKQSTQKLEQKQQQQQNLNLRKILKNLNEQKTRAIRDNIIKIEDQSPQKHYDNYQPQNFIEYNQQDSSNLQKLQLQKETDIELKNINNSKEYDDASNNIQTTRGLVSQSTFDTFYQQLQKNRASVSRLLNLPDFNEQDSQELQSVESEDISFDPKDLSFAKSNQQTQSFKDLKLNQSMNKIKDKSIANNLCDLKLNDGEECRDHQNSYYIQE
eukprot:403368123